MTSKKSMVFWILVVVAVSCAGPQPSREGANENLMVSRKLQEWTPADGMWTREQISDWFIADTLQWRMAGIVRVGKPEGSISTPGTILGHGFVVSRDGYILSADHIVHAGMKEVQIFFRDGGTFKGDVVLKDETLGFALIKIRGEKDFPALHLGDVSKLRAGAFCLAPGWTTGRVGIVSSVGRIIPKRFPLCDFLQTSPIITHQNGGGPLLDVYGAVVGISHSRIRTSLSPAGPGFASPIGPTRDRIRSFVAVHDESPGGPVPVPVLRTQEAVMNAITRAARSTVNIQRADQAGRSLGSGVVVSREGHVLTTAHVVGGVDGRLHVVSPGTGSVPGRVIGKYPNLDLALIKVDGERGFEPIAVGRYDELKRGEFVMAIGNPFGLGLTAECGTIQSIVYNPLEPGSGYEFLGTDVPLNPGNSGGPMVNLRGEMVGINIALIRRLQGMEFAASMTPEVVDRIIRAEKIDEIRLSWNGKKDQVTWIP